MPHLTWTRVFIAAGCIATAACARPHATLTDPHPTGPLAWDRAWSIRSAPAPVGFETIVTQAAKADIVFFGEEHDDPETHFAELALLEAIGRTRTNVVLSLEMFERDVQPLLDDYLAGRITETAFLAKARPWDNYTTDYRPLVLLAKVRGWPVIAANVPRPIASAVSRQGLPALDTLPPASRAWVAKDIRCPHDLYYDNFAREMTGHSPGQPAIPSTPAMQTMTDRFFEAQCIKDETMAESIAQAAARAGQGGIVVHFTGSFHTDQGLGTADRLRRRVPSGRLVLITALPVPDPTTARYESQTPPLADFVIFTRATPPK